MDEMGEQSGGSSGRRRNIVAKVVGNIPDVAASEEMMWQ